MNKHRLLFELDKVAGRYRLLRFWQLLAAAWLVAAVVGVGLLAIKLGLSLPLPAAVPAPTANIMMPSLYARAARSTASWS